MYLIFAIHIIIILNKYQKYYGFYHSSLVTTKANTNQVIRSDGRCGSSVPLDDGSPAQCDPKTEYYCCSKWGYCGSTDEHCDCADCVNYRKDDASGIQLMPFNNF